MRQTLIRLFGSGPAIFFLSVGTLAGAAAIAQATPDFAMNLPQAVRGGAVAVGAVLGAGLALWSVVALTPERRGKALFTGGPFAVVRHPLYAAGLSFLAPGFVLWFDHWVFVAWLVLIHAVANWAIGFEEGKMRAWFGGEWDAYAARTGRFFPKLV